MALSGLEVDILETMQFSLSKTFRVLGEEDSCCKACLRGPQAHAGAECYTTPESELRALMPHKMR